MAARAARSEQLLQPGEQFSEAELAVPIVDDHVAVQINSVADHSDIGCGQTPVENQAEARVRAHGHRGNAAPRSAAAVHGADRISR